MKQGEQKSANFQERKITGIEAGKYGFSAKIHLVRDHGRSLDLAKVFSELLYRLKPIRMMAEKHPRQDGKWTQLAFSINV